MKKILLLLFTSSFIFQSCRKLDVPDPAFENIFDRWEWVRTTGGISGNVITPNNSFRNVTLFLKERGRWRIKSSIDNESYRERYFFEGDSYLVNGNPATRIRFKDDKILPLELILKGDTLFTNQADIADGLQFVYVRAK
ncbi:MAG: hypothetical protein ACRCYO_11595 [Bacteroidia bacterium]